MEVNHRADLSSRFFSYPRVRSVASLSCPSCIYRVFRTNFVNLTSAPCWRRVLVCYRYVLLIRRVIASLEKYQETSFIRIAKLTRNHVLLVVNCEMSKNHFLHFSGLIEKSLRRYEIVILRSLRNFCPRPFILKAMPIQPVRYLESWRSFSSVLLPNV